METVLTHKSFSVKKKSIDANVLYNLKKDLTAQQKTNPDFPDVRPFAVYEEIANWIRVPRFYGISKFGEPSKTTLKDHLLPPKNIEFSGELRESQTRAYDEVTSRFQEGNTLKNKSGILTKP
jgi:hypothetical protein